MSFVGGILMKTVLIFLILVLSVLSFPYGESFEEDYETLIKLGEKQIEKKINYYQYNCFVTNEKRAEITFIFMDVVPTLSILERIDNLVGVFVIKFYKPSGTISTFEFRCEYSGRMKKGGVAMGGLETMQLIKPDGAIGLKNGSIIDIKEDYCVIAVGDFYDEEETVTDFTTFYVSLYISGMEIDFGNVLESE